MRNLFLSLFDHAFASCKRHKAITIWLIVALTVSVILGVVAGIRINHSSFPQDFSNVGYVKYLRDDVGFAGFIFTEIFTIIVSITMEFGFFNTVILLIFLVAISLIYFYLFLLVVVECFDCIGMPNYFSGCFCTIIPLIISFLLVALCNAIFLLVLKNFVFVLVYK